MEALINGNTKVALCFCLYKHASPYRACAPALGFSLFFPQIEVCWPDNRRCTAGLIIQLSNGRCAPLCAICDKLLWLSSWTIN